MPPLAVSFYATRLLLITMNSSKVYNVAMKQCINLLNQRFGRLTVIEKTSDRASKGEVVWKCLCDCGQERWAKSSALRSKEIVSCGCTWDEAAARRLKNMAGIKVGRLLVLQRAGSTRFGQAQWLCQCECGQQTIVSGQCLRIRQTKSCGCLKTEAAKRNIKLAKNSRTLPPGNGHFNVIYNRYRNDAKRSNREFALTIEEFRTLTQQDCYYCGQSPRPFGSGYRLVNGVYIGNGIDRVDNAGGYTMDNVVTACKECNYAKRALARDQFIALACRIAEKHRFTE